MEFHRDSTLSLVPKNTCDTVVYTVSSTTAAGADPVVWTSCEDPEYVVVRARVTIAKQESSVPLASGGK